MSDAAIANIVTGTVTVSTMIIGFLTLWVKLKYESNKAEKAATTAAETVDNVSKKVAKVEEKLDTNTKITKTGMEQAATAASEAKHAAELAQSNNQKMNGGIDDAMAKAVRPLQETMESHILNDELFMRDIRQALAELKLRIK